MFFSHSITTGIWMKVPDGFSDGFLPIVCNQERKICLYLEGRYMLSHQISIDEVVLQCFFNEFTGMNF